MWRVPKGRGGHHDRGRARRRRGGRNVYRGCSVGRARPQARPESGVAYHYERHGPSLRTQDRTRRGRAGFRPSVRAIEQKVAPKLTMRRSSDQIRNRSNGTEISTTKPVEFHAWEMVPPNCPWTLCLQITVPNPSAFGAPGSVGPPRSSHIIIRTSCGVVHIT